MALVGSWWESGSSYFVNLKFARSKVPSCSWMTSGRHVHKRTEAAARLIRAGARSAGDVDVQLAGAEGREQAQPER